MISEKENFEIQLNPLTHIPKQIEVDSIEYWTQSLSSNKEEKLQKE